ncbi:MAG: hypothetical protein M5U28_04925 [Sandaracinaceae bacterium]|nr:hypothetical protein [Sandaracinaceae bacterium]
MRGASAIVALLAALSAAGCTLLFKPDRDAIAADLDGGVDGGTEDAGDAGAGDAGDAGPDGGRCVPQEAEDCTDPAGADEDCDGQSNCFDYDCRGVAACCRPGGASTPRCLESLADFVRLPADHASDIQFSDTLCNASTRVTEFGPAGRARALVTQRCQPITFGMQLSVILEITEACTGACDYAALAFGPVQTLADGDPFPSELRVVLRGDGSAGVDRAGTPIGEQRPMGTFSLGQRVTVRVDLEPGPDESGQDVLFATVDLAVTAGPGGGRILSRTAVAPLEALECIRPGGGPPAWASTRPSRARAAPSRWWGRSPPLERRCSNPSQFYESSDPVDLSQIEACAAGGIGAPALVGYCRGGCGTAGPAVQWDLWVDASRTPRVEESFRFVDFGVCGYGWQTPVLPDTPSWIARPQSPFLIGDATSSREPTVMPVSDDGATTTRVAELVYAYARREAPSKRSTRSTAAPSISGSPSRPRPSPRRCSSRATRAACRCATRCWSRTTGRPPPATPWTAPGCSSPASTRAARPTRSGSRASPARASSRSTARSPSAPTCSPPSRGPTRRAACSRPRASWRCRARRARRSWSCGSGTSRATARGRCAWPTRRAARAASTPSRRSTPTRPTPSSPARAARSASAPRPAPSPARRSRRASDRRASGSS